MKRSQVSLPSPASPSSPEDRKSSPPSPKMVSRPYRAMIVLASSFAGDDVVEEGTVHVHEAGDGVGAVARGGSVDQTGGHAHGSRGEREQIVPGSAVQDVVSRPAVHNIGGALGTWDVV